MRLRDRTEDLDPQAERELEAIDLALAGRDVDSDLADWAELAEMLRDERPEADQQWAAELDERAAERFPKGNQGQERPGDSRPPTRSGPSNESRFAGFLPRRMVPAVAGFAVLAVALVVGVSTLGGGGSDDSGSADSATSVATTSDDASSGPFTAQSAGGASAGAADSAESAAPEAAPFDSGRLRDLSGDIQISPASKRIAPGTDNRKVDRDVTMELAAPPEEVNGVSDKAIGITRELGGIVSTSNVSTAGKQASASLELVIPTRNLDTAIDRLTDIADVKSLNESSTDITHTYVSVQDELQDAEAKREQLLKALGNATTDTEAQALQLQIDLARKEIAQAQAAFDKIQRKAQLSTLSLTITGDTSASSKDDGNRTIGDWLDDALSVLRDVAGVLLITAAIAVPVGILIAIAWLIVSRTKRRRRDRALDD